jgi:branched-chain amino acid transport system permease protein
MDIFPQLVANSIIAGSIYALVALGFNLIFGAVRFFDLGFGALIAVGGYAALYFSKALGLPSGMALILAVFVAGLVGYLVERFVYRRLRSRKASKLVLLVASLGVLTVLQAVLAMLFTSQFQVLSTGLIPNDTITLLGAVLTYTQVLIFCTSIVVMLALHYLLYHTAFGTAVRAISDDEEVASIVGIHTERVIGIVFFIGSAIGGLAGIMVGLDIGLDPTMGLGLLLKGVVAAIIGGAGNVFGGVAGAFLLAFVENFGAWHVSGEWKDAIAFALLIVFLVVRPKGLFRK